jgi:hypothetical protein
MGVGVSDRYNGMSAVEVKVLLAFVIPNFASFALDNVYVKEWIYVK